MAKEWFGPRGWPALRRRREAVPGVLRRGRRMPGIPCGLKG